MQVNAFYMSIIYITYLLSIQEKHLYFIKNVLSLVKIASTIFFTAAETTCDSADLEPGYII